jgi:hypothetical protein
MGKLNGGNRSVECESKRKVSMRVLDSFLGNLDASRIELILERGVERTRLVFPKGRCFLDASQLREGLLDAFDDLLLRPTLSVERKRKSPGITAFFSDHAIHVHLAGEEMSRQKSRAEPASGFRFRVGVARFRGVLLDEAHDVGGPEGAAVVAKRQEGIPIGLIQGYGNMKPLLGSSHILGILQQLPKPSTTSTIPTFVLKLLNAIEDVLGNEIRVRAIAFFFEVVPVAHTRREYK